MLSVGSFDVENCEVSGKMAPSYIDDDDLSVDTFVENFHLQERRERCC
jgi:hypothetical protein